MPREKIVLKIYRLPIPADLQPDHQDFVWPPRNREPGWDFGVEQDFSRWLNLHPEYVTTELAQADWCVAEVYWNRLYINSRDEAGNWGGSAAHHAYWLATVNDLRTQAGSKPLFTISEAGIRTLKPWLPLDTWTIFCASRREENDGIDIPLLSAPHPYRAGVEKKHLACFLGNMNMDGWRIRLRELAGSRADCRIEHANHGPEEFTTALLSSYIALAPRGQGAQSFRMYEGMQLGAVPLYIGDQDCRPFKRWLDWDSYSFYLADVEQINAYLDDLATGPKDRLLTMGQAARWALLHDLDYGQWCRYVLATLEEMS